MSKVTKRAYTRKGTEPEAFKLIEGIPVSKSRTSEEDQKRLRNTLKLLDKTHHFVVPVKFMGALKRIAANDFPEYQIRVSVNKEKKICSVWRVK